MEKHEVFAALDHELTFCRQRRDQLKREHGDPGTLERFNGSVVVLERLAKQLHGLDSPKYAGIGQLLRAYGLPTSDWTFGQGTLTVHDPETGEEIAYFDVITERAGATDEIISLRVKGTSER